MPIPSSTTQEDEEYTRMFGIETEYALVHTGCNDINQRTRVSNRIVEAASETYEALPSNQSGIFFRNGGRLYVDTGAHLEYATPECSTPDELVNHVRAGDAILQGLVQGREKFVLLRNNVDYLTPCTWGSHESYLHRCFDSNRLATQMIPHIISRQVYCGAGGFDPFSPTLEFAIAPRVLFFHHEQSESVLAMFSTRREHLSTNGDLRLHVTLGESLCSNNALWLRVAATFLVVALIDADLLEDHETVQLEDSVKACHMYTRDLSLQVASKTVTGKSVTALDIQRYYL